MEALLETKIEKDLEILNNSKKEEFIFFFFEAWEKIYPYKNESKLQLELYELLIANIKKQLFNEKELERPDKLILIDLLEEYNEKKDTLLETEAAKFKTPEMLALEKKQNSEAAYRLYKKFQSGREIKAK